MAEFIVLKWRPAPWPTLARGQQKATPLIGYLHLADPSYAPAK